MPALRRSLVVAAAVILALLPVFSASASTADDLEAAKQRLATARTAANDARAASHDAEVQLQETEDHIAEVGQTISDLKQKAAALHDVVRKRALYAYTHAGNDIDVAVGTDDPLAAARGQALIDEANQKDNTAVKRLAAINSDLHDQTAALRDEESKQRAVKDQLDVRNNQFQASLAEAQAATTALQAQYDQEIAAAQGGGAQGGARKERAAFAAARPVTPAASRNLGAGQVVANPNPGGGSFMCPVFGAAYSDDYGGPSGHPGNDLFVGIGTQAFAVKAGTVRYVANEGAGGNTAYLHADDGNSLLAHLSQFVGAGTNGGAG